MSRLLEALYRERCVPASALRRNAAGKWFLHLGRPPALRAPVTGPLPFRRLQVNNCPRALSRDSWRPLRTPDAFLSALRRSLATSAIARYFDRLAADFNNSFANLVLNNLLGRHLNGEASAIEPVYQGHTHYPFPALRIGPSVADVVSCSNLCRRAIDLPMVAVQPGRLDSPHFDDHRACHGAWAGRPLPPRNAIVIPLHPWHLKLSPLVRDLLDGRWITLLENRVRAVPLASQRTCRILATGFDIKLPIAATLTSQERLLYPLNRANAPTISALARVQHERSAERTLEFQYDLATLAHADPDIGTHLSAIVRAPVPHRAGEVVVPALNLWSGPRQARTLLDLHDPEGAYKFFRVYCRVLMRGPIDLYARWGMAFEPHLQNVSVALCNGVPSRIILRDLDSTILDPDRIRPVLRRHGLPLAPGTWQHMPTFDVGGRRLAHAMMAGHLGEVMGYLIDAARAEVAVLETLLNDVWNEIHTSASPSSRRWVRDLRAHGDTVTAMLQMRLRRSRRLMFV
ncbi:MAG: hypothetical protein C5B48_09505 [Candidatus Rokuibacteriota bacterium]|nr:MAG: hypothetical protein C5B48_09505 [Candidatus Rokubacteria bacterium]